MNGTAARRSEAFETLGLPPDASREMVRRAFRRLAFGCHPDLHGGLPEMAEAFQKLADAYRIAARTADTETQTSAPPPGRTPASSHAPARGSDLHYRLRLDFTQAALGGEVSLRYARRTACPACGDEKIKTCAKCAGAGRVKKTAIVDIRVPAGVEDEETLRLRGAGDESASGGPAGDLHVLISTRGHPAFQRRGLDIYSEVKLPVYRLGNGGPVRVYTIHGAQHIPIPPRTEPGTMFRLRGCGVRRDQAGSQEEGDHFVRVGEIEPETYERSMRADPGGVNSRGASLR